MEAKIDPSIKKPENIQQKQNKPVEVASGEHATLGIAPTLTIQRSTSKDYRALTSMSHSSPTLLPLETHLK